MQDLTALAMDAGAMGDVASMQESYARWTTTNVKYSCS